LVVYNSFFCLDLNFNIIRTPFVCTPPWQAGVFFFKSFGKIESLDIYETRISYHYLLLLVHGAIIIIIIMQKPQGVVNSLYYPLKHWVWKENEKENREKKKTSIYYRLHLFDKIILKSSSFFFVFLKNYKPIRDFYFYFLGQFFEADDGPVIIYNWT
jgi:hypothetical protein